MLVYTGAFLLVLAVFTAALTCGVLLHANVGLARSVIASRVTDLLAPVFRGRIAIEHVGRVGFSGIEGAQVRVRDESGRQVIFAQAIDTKVETLLFLRSLLEDTVIRVVIPQAKIGYAEVTLEEDANGAPRIVDAFEPTRPTNHTETAQHREVHVTVSSASVGRVWVHGVLPGIPLVDAEMFNSMGTVLVSPDRLRVVLHGAGLTARGMPQGANPIGALEGTLSLPLTGAIQRRATLRFEGDVGGIPTFASASLEGRRLNAEVSGRLEPDSRRPLVPELFTREALVFQVHAMGSLPRLRVRAELRMGAARGDVDGEVVFGNRLTLDLALRARHLNLDALFEDAPPSDVGLGATARAELVDGVLRGSFTARSREGRVGGVDAPPFTVEGRFHGLAGTATAVIHTEFAPIDAELRLRRERSGPVLDVRATSRHNELARIEEFRGVLSGLVRLDASATLELRAGTVSATVRADSPELHATVVDVREAVLEARFEGSLSNPRVDATFRGRRTTGPLATQFSSVSLAANGDLRALRVAGLLSRGARTFDIGATGVLNVGRKLVVTHGLLVAGTGGAAITVRTPKIELGRGGVSMRSAVLEGLGDPVTASVVAGRNSLKIQAEGSRVQVSRVARFFEWTTPFGGEASFAVDLDAGTAGATGDVRLTVQDGAIGPLTGGGAQLRVKLRDDRATGFVRARLGESRVELLLDDLRLGGSPAHLRSWARIQGSLKGDAIADLAEVRPLLPKGSLPFEDVSGKITVAGELTRADPAQPPEVHVSARTRSLRLSTGGLALSGFTGILVKDRGHWMTSGLDLEALVTTATMADAPSLRGRFTVRDAKGPLVSARMSARLPDRQTYEQSSDLAWLVDLPFEARIAVEARKIAELPVPFTVPDAKGTVELLLQASDTLRNPTIDVVGHLNEFRLDGQRADRVNVEARARYADGLGTVDLSAHVGEEETLRSHSRFATGVPDLTALHTRGPLHAKWDVESASHVSGFPLSLLPVFARVNARGLLNGDFAFDASSEAPLRARGKLRTERLAVGRASGYRASLDVDLENHELRSRLEIQQPGGVAEVVAQGGFAWFGGDVGGRPLDVTLRARGFRIALFRPFVQEFIHGLDGNIDADAHVALVANAPPRGASGHVRVTDGAFQLVGFDEEFHGVATDIVVHEDGEIRADDIVARGVSGELRGSVSAFVDGAHIGHIRGEARIPRREPLRMVYQGQSLGEAWGDLTVDATRRAPFRPGATHMDVDLQLRHAGVRIPQGSTNALQPLKPADGIRIGVRDGRKFVSVPTGYPSGGAQRTGATYRLAAHVHDLQIEQGTGLRVRVDGDPVIRIDEATHVTGRVRLTGGTFEVQGKRFEIEHGTATFEDDPDNPMVDVTAGWNAGDGTRVYADYVGPLRSGKVTLRSEPPRTQNEILTLIVLGTTGAEPGTNSMAGAGVAGVAELGGGVAALGINRAIGDVTGLDVTARVATAAGGNPRPEVELRIAQDLSVAIAHVLGVPPPGTNPDRNYARLDWRFLRNLWLETTFGDAGSAMLDLVWRYQY